MSTILLSVKPRYAASLLDGSKTIELRKRSFKISAPVRVVIYSSTPQKAIIGEVSLARAELMPLSQLWSKHGMSACITRADFDMYYEGHTHGVGLHIVAPKPYKNPIQLERLRRLGIYPPQSYARLSKEQLSNLIED